MFVSNSFIDFSGQNELWALDAEATLQQVMSTLSQPMVKRVPILDKKSKLKRFVTQSQVLTILNGRLDDFGPIVDCTVKQLGLGYYRPPSEYDSLSFHFFFLVLNIDSDSVSNPTS